MLSVSTPRRVFRIALVLLALLPMQLAVETGIAYLFLPRQYSAIIDSQHDLEHPLVQEILADVPLTRFTWHLLHVTQAAFFIGLALLVILGLLSILRTRTKAI